MPWTDHIMSMPTNAFRGVLCFSRSSGQTFRQSLRSKSLRNINFSLGVDRQVQHSIMPSDRDVEWRNRVRALSSTTSSDPALPTETEGIRLSKFLSQPNTNLSMSRRQAERLIRDGDVTVAGRTITSPHYRLSPDDTTGIKVSNQHLVESGDKGITASPTKVWLVHKLAGEIVTENDPHGRPSLLDRLQRGGVGRGKNRHHLKPIGRLDMSTEGLILVTNDGQYARELELPSNYVQRVYRVRLFGTLTPHKLKRIRSGLTVENMRYRGMKVQLEGNNRNGANTWLRLTCTEGKNRQIRKIFTHLGLRVLRLIRISYGDYQLQTIPPGMAIEVPVKPLKKQRRQGSMLTHEKRTTKQPKGGERQQTVQWIRH